MNVKIRLMGADPAELAAAESAIRTVLDVPAQSADYASKRAGDPTWRRYLEATGVLQTARGGR